MTNCVEEKISNKVKALKFINFNKPEPSFPSEVCNHSKQN